MSTACIECVHNRSHWSVMCKNGSALRPTSWPSVPSLCPVFSFIPFFHFPPTNILHCHTYSTTTHTPPPPLIQSTKHPHFPRSTHLTFSLSTPPHHPSHHTSMYATKEPILPHRQTPVAIGILTILYLNRFPMVSR